MKKIVLSFIWFFGFLTGYSQQYPVNQFLGSPTTLVTARGALKADSALILPAFTDTAKANISPFIKNYAGTLIRVGDSLYVRSNDVSQWLLLGSGGGVPINAWLLNGNSNAIAGTNYLGTINNIPLEFRVKNIKSGIIDSTYRNTALGYASQRFSQAIPGTDTAINNTSMGFRALGANIYGDDNTAIGYAANALGTNLIGNTSLGYGAGAQNRSSTYDVAIGWGAMPRDFYGSANVAVGADIANLVPPSVGDTMRYNTMMGYASAYTKKAGNNNVFIGDSTGAANVNGSRNVFIGSKAGKNETGSDKLYIANSATTSPLIKGDFANQTVIIDGKLLVGGSQIPDSTLDVKGGVRFQALLPSNNASDSMLIVKSNGGVGYRSIPSAGSSVSISQGYGIANSPNPITSTGTITADTSVSGLSGKYLRINDTSTMLTPYVKGIGTANYIPKFTSTSTIGNSIIQDLDDGFGFLRTTKIDYGGSYGLFKMNCNGGAGTALAFTKNNNNAWQLESTSTNDFTLSSYNPSSGAYVGNVFTIPTNSNTFGINNLTPNTAYGLDVTGKVLLRDLGLGGVTRMVVATSTGELQTQAIPSGGGGVTSITQGYGITNSPNPIVATGTVRVDTSVSGLSGKYLRIVDTANKFVNNVTKLNDSTITIFKGNTSTNIVLPPSVVYTENPIMSRTSGDSNIIYFNPDTANVWRGGGGGSGTVTSVGLTMPSAFSVANSPIINNGTIAVTGAGVVSQYIRGDGSLANFPTSTGGGSSVSYYLNGSVSQGTIGGVAFREMNKTPIIGAGTDFTINADGYIQSFITDAGDPALLNIPAGNWNFEMYFSASSRGGSPRFYLELYKWDGTTLSLISSNSATPESITGGTAIDLYTTALAVPTTTLLATDRLAVRVYVIHSGRTITLHTEDSHLCQVITTFTTGLTALNGLTVQVQNFATGTSGTDFGISSSTATHTFNLPDASATNRGALTSANWTTFNNKIGASDTSVFQRKSISANTIMANNTASAANVTAQAFYDKPEQAYTGTITFTGTAPTTIINNTYQWSQIGKTVTLFVNLLYSGGNATTNIIFDLPSDCPTPSVPSGYSGASSVLYFGTYAVSNSLTSILRNGQSHLRRNSANSAYEITSPAWASIVSRNFQFQITYRAQ